VVKLCARYEVPIVTQGGNTGMCGGATPNNKGDAVLLVTTRLNHILNVDTVNDTITVQAGCILQQVQEAAAKQDRLFPLSLVQRVVVRSVVIWPPMPVAHRSYAMVMPAT